MIGTWLIQSLSFAMLIFFDRNIRQNGDSKFAFTVTPTGGWLVAEIQNIIVGQPAKSLGGC